MFLRSARVLALVCLTVIGVEARPLQAPIEIDNDIRVFTMVAALNVAGFDIELASQYHPARVEIRKIAEGLDPALVKRMRDFYSSHRPSGSDDDQLAKYISLAVVLTDPPAFKPIAREEALPDDARSVLGFVPLLQEFYQKAGVLRLWSKVGPAYELEMDRIGPSIRNAVARTDSYLRVASGGVSSQSMKVTIELGAPQNSVNVRSHQDDYYVILGYSATPKTEEIRHAYLHLRLNNYITAASSKVTARAGLMTLLFDAGGVQRDYSNNFENMLTESLIRAVELRIDRAPAATAEETIRTNYRSGLLLMPYFYEALPAYETGDNPFRDEIPILFGAIDLGKEQARFDTTFSSIPAPQRQVTRGEVPVAPRVDPVQELLQQAQASFEKDKPKARAAFEKVLKDHDANNGRALYGIALIEMDMAAADQAHLDTALDFFQRTIKSDSAGKSMKTWSYIYSGHILDFKCNRAGALENYRRAIEIGDDTRDAQRTAKRDLEQPFGGECQQ